MNRSFTFAIRPVPHSPTHREQEAHGSGPSPWMQHRAGRTRGIAGVSAWRIGMGKNVLPVLRGETAPSAVAHGTGARALRMEVHRGPPQGRGCRDADFPPGPAGILPGAGRPALPGMPGSMTGGRNATAHWLEFNYASVLQSVTVKPFKYSQ